MFKKNEKKKKKLDVLMPHQGVGIWLWGFRCKCSSSCQENKSEMVHPLGFLYPLPILHQV